MTVRSPGYGLRGKDGSNGSNGTNSTISVGSTTTGAPGSSASVSNGGTPSAAVLNFTIPRGADGLNGSNGTNGTNGTNASVLVGTVTLAESALITLALGVRRVTVALAGTVTTGSYVAAPTAAPPSGYSIQDAYCSTAGQITVGIIVPALGIATNYSIQVRIFRLN